VANGGGFTSCHDASGGRSACPFTPRLLQRVTLLDHDVAGGGQHQDPVDPLGMLFTGPDTIAISGVDITATQATVHLTDSGPGNSTYSDKKFDLVIVASNGNLLVDNIVYVAPSALLPADVYSAHFNGH
jgi:hypothetical protein